MANNREVPQKEKRGAISSAPLTIAALPFPGPTRLADGLELEVFYATPIGITIRPGFRLAEHWIPRVKSAFRATSTSADNSCQRGESYSAKMMDAIRTALATGIVVLISSFS
jgi:hypothetical protein